MSKPKIIMHDPDQPGACCKCPLQHSGAEYVYCGLHRTRDVIDDDGAPQWCPLRKGDVTVRPVKAVRP